MSCEDFPCCGHEWGCCPSYNDDGEQTNMVCTCGAELPVNARYSICDDCNRLDDEEFEDECEFDEFNEDRGEMYNERYEREFYDSYYEDRY